jgi:hypothetical protein
MRITGALGKDAGADRSAGLQATTATVRRRQAKRLRIISAADDTEEGGLIARHPGRVDGERDRAFALVTLASVERERADAERKPAGCPPLRRSPGG